MKYIGRCTKFCPLEEEKNRIYLKRLSIFEQKDNFPGEIIFIIKEYIRLSTSTINLNNIRDIDTLKSVSNYLLIQLFPKVIIKGSNDMKSQIFEFINNRLRAIRQDAIVQHCISIEFLKILVQSIRFHLLTEYLACNKIIYLLSFSWNRFLLGLCLMQALQIYLKVNKYTCYKQDPQLYELSSEIISYVVLISLNNRRKLLNILDYLYFHVKHELISHPICSITLNIAKEVLDGNITRVLHLITKLPFFGKCAIISSITYLRNLYLDIFTTANSNGKGLKVTLSSLKTLLSFQNEDTLIEYIKPTGLIISEDLIKIYRSQKYIFVNNIEMIPDVKFLFSKSNFLTTEQDIAYLFKI
ncbi:hypothetical protein cand_001220 [Cryptosporidium andersoni]|uniref:SAC3/GANP/THP3 conserved domain-containing protein n=1 Tax=Cryptosporidium andersoni TaxID=117008 RepID=A0A1J4MRB1_9CRYT|nr:hypothetical protein cand_001220 [Cryptosporidium andersoni]